MSEVRNPTRILPPKPKLFRQIFPKKKRPTATSGNKTTNRSNAPAPRRDDDESLTRQGHVNTGQSPGNVIRPEKTLRWFLFRFLFFFLFQNRIIEPIKSRMSITGLWQCLWSEQLKTMAVKGETFVTLVFTHLWPQLKHFPWKENL